MKKKITDPKIKIEFNDVSGARYSFAVEGGLSKENMVKLLDFVQSVSPPTVEERSPSLNADLEGTDTNFARVYLMLEQKFRFGSFTSNDVREASSDELGLVLTLPTVSTYLSRLTERGLLTRSRNGVGWVYKLAKLPENAEIPDSLH